MRIYPVFIPHSGCPHRCLFCSQDRTTGQSAAPQPEDVALWLNEVLPAAGDGEVAFYGGTFTLLPNPLQERYLSIAQSYVAAGRIAGIRISTRPDALDNTCTSRLRQFGVTTVEIGAQSFDDQVLSASNRGHSAADIVQALHCCRSAKLDVGLQLLPGLPEAGAGEALLSLRCALELEPDFLRIYPAVVIAGTGLAELWASGRYLPWSLDEAVNICADMLQLCRASNVPVIRLGLQQEPELERHLLAGPYHAAFGQLVRSRLWRRALSRVSVGGEMSVNPNDLSDAVGHRGENRQWLVQQQRQLSLRTDTQVARGWLRVADNFVPLVEACVPGGPL